MSKGMAFWVWTERMGRVLQLRWLLQGARVARRENIGLFGVTIVLGAVAAVERIIPVVGGEHRVVQGGREAPVTKVVRREVGTPQGEVGEAMVQTLLAAMAPAVVVVLVVENVARVLMGVMAE